MSFDGGEFGKLVQKNTDFQDANYRRLTTNYHPLFEYGQTWTSANRHLKHCRFRWTNQNMRLSLRCLSQCFNFNKLDFKEFIQFIQTLQKFFTGQSDPDLFRLVAVTSLPLTYCFAHPFLICYLLRNLTHHLYFSLNWSLRIGEALLPLGWESLSLPPGRSLG